VNEKTRQKSLLSFIPQGHKFRLSRQAAQLSFIPQGHKFRLSRQAAQLSFIDDPHIKPCDLFWIRNLSGNFDCSLTVPPTVLLAASEQVVVRVVVSSQVKSNPNVSNFKKFHLTIIQKQPIFLTFKI